MADPQFYTITVDDGTPQGRTLEIEQGTPPEVVARIVREHTGASRGLGDFLSGLGSGISSRVKGAWETADTLANTVKGAITSPIGTFDYKNDPGVQMLGNTAKGLGEMGRTVLTGIAHGGPTTVSGIAAMAQTPAGQAIGKDYYDHYGSWEKTKDTFFDDPLRMGFDVASVASPALRGASAGAMAANMPRLANGLRIAANPVSTAAKSVAASAVPRLDNWAFGRHRDSLGLSHKDIATKEGARRAIEAQRQYDTRPTVGGFRRVEGMIDGLQAQKEAEFVAHPSARGLTDVPELDNWTGERWTTRGVDPDGFAGAERVRNTFTEAHQRPVYGLVNGQYQQIGQRMPRTLPVRVLDNERNRLGAILNPAYQKGEEMPPAHIVDARKKLYTDLSNSVKAAVPSTAPLDAQLRPLHSLRNQMLQGPLGQRHSDSTYLTNTAQIASFLGRGKNAIEAQLGHWADRTAGLPSHPGSLGTGLSGYAARPQSLGSQLLPQIVAGDAMLDTVADAQDDDDTRARFRQLTGVRY
jgi:hypothetical protein